MGDCYLIFVGGILLVFLCLLLVCVCSNFVKYSDLNLWVLILLVFVKFMLVRYVIGFGLNYF